MTAKDQRLRLVLNYCEKIQSFLQGVSKDDWDNNEEKRLAVSYSLMAISENIKELLKIDPRLEQKYNEVPWSQIAKFRDKMSHHYEKTDPDIVFAIALNNTAQIISFVKKELVQP